MGALPLNVFFAGGIGTLRAVSTGGPSAGRSPTLVPDKPFDGPQHDGVGDIQRRRPFLETIQAEARTFWGYLISENMRDRYLGRSRPTGKEGLDNLYVRLEALNAGELKRDRTVENLDFVATPEGSERTPP
jgi:hypothetical protein